jgi:hypothetical protein
MLQPKEMSDILGMLAEAMDGKQALSLPNENGKKFWYCGKKGI